MIDDIFLLLVESLSTLLERTKMSLQLKDLLIEVVRMQSMFDIREIHEGTSLYR